MLHLSDPATPALGHFVANPGLPPASPVAYSSLASAPTTQTMCLKLRRLCHFTIVQKPCKDLFSLQSDFCVIIYSYSRRGEHCLEFRRIIGPNGFVV